MEGREQRFVYKVDCQSAERREQLKDLIRVLKQLSDEKNTYDFLLQLGLAELFRKDPEKK